MKALYILKLLRELIDQDRLAIKDDFDYYPETYIHPINNVDATTSKTMTLTIGDDTFTIKVTPHE